ncbi:MAG: hypothetical protein ACI9XC_001685 [Gammaproteobacteria bacterium]|jgi:uncharacterized protein (DUF427 family)
MKAIWNNQVLAESNETIVVDNNHYFPSSSLIMTYFSASDNTSHCPWKGDANYYNIVVNDKENKDAAWYYATPKDAASEIKDHVAFWRGVKIEE